MRKAGFAVFVGAGVGKVPVGVAFTTGADVAGGVCEGDIGVAVASVLASFKLAVKVVPSWGTTICWDCEPPCAQDRKP